jgi:hypothetical protein
MFSSLPSETPFCLTAFDPALYQEFPLIALFNFPGPLLICELVIHFCLIDPNFGLFTLKRRHDELTRSRWVFSGNFKKPRKKG